MPYVLLLADFLMHTNYKSAHQLLKADLTSLEHPHWKRKIHDELLFINVLRLKKKYRKENKII